MLTVVESPIFQKLWPLYWEEDEQDVYLITLFAKAEKENIPLATLKEIRHALEI